MKKKAILGIVFGNISCLLVLFIIVLHGIVRIPEIPYAEALLGEYYWAPAINFAAGKGFTDDRTYSEASPELAKFSRFCKMSRSKENKNGILTDKLKPYPSLHTYKDYTPKTHRLHLPDGNGYRLVVGILWKYFGYNWYYVGLLNYFFSLLALLSLLYCSYRVLGAPYSIAIGFIYATSLVETYYVANFGRDGTPLWFASYLICMLVLLFNRELTLKRLTNYALLIGVIIFLAIEGRSSSIYFLPIVSIIYFIMIYFFKNPKIRFTHFSFLNNYFIKQTFVFTYTCFLTIFTTFLLSKLMSYFIPEINSARPVSFMHVIFLGLGVWADPSTFGNPTTPGLLRYNDGFVTYLAMEFGRRALNYTNIDYASIYHRNSLAYLYYLIANKYPFFFFYKVVFESIFNTLVNLGEPIRYGVYKAHRYGKLFLYETRYLYKWKLIFILSFIGSLLLYYKFKLRKVLFILLTFIFFNAGMSFLQYGARHALMGHPAYYFLNAVTLGFIFDYIKGLDKQFVKELPFSLLTAIEVQKKAILARISFLKINWKFSIKHGLHAILILSILPTFFLVKRKLNSIEKANIKEMQLVFHSLNKTPLKVDLTKKGSNLPDALLSKSVGIYCTIGQVSKPKPIHAELHLNKKIFYKTNIKPVVGENVILFIPFFYPARNYQIVFHDPSRQCKSYYWSDLKDWKGPLWEGSYDQSKFER